MNRRVCCAPTGTGRTAIGLNLLWLALWGYLGYRIYDRGSWLKHAFLINLLPALSQILLIWQHFIPEAQQSGLLVDIGLTFQIPVMYLSTWLTRSARYAAAEDTAALLLTFLVFCAGGFAAHLRKKRISARTGNFPV